jgi:multidrug resistance efflux pump
VVLLLSIGVGAFLYLWATKERPGGESEPVAGRVVRAFPAEQATHRMAITAYGTTRAAEVWTAIAEVNGRVQELHPLFEPGEIFNEEEEGKLLVAIDPTDYELAEKRLAAEVRAKEEQLAEHEQNEENLGAILKLQQRQLDLARSEYERQWEAFQRNAVSESVLEQAQDAYVRAQTAVQQTQNGLALMAPRPSA